INEGIEVVRRGHGVENEIEAVGVRGHFGPVLRDHHLGGSQAERVVLLLRRCGEQHHLGAHGVGDLHRHVAQPAETDHADLLARPDLPLAQRRIGGDAGAEQRRDGGQVVGLTDAQHIFLVHHYGVRRAAEGVLAAAERRAVVGADETVLAVLLQALATGGAIAATVDQATDDGEVIDLETADRRADGHDATDDLVAGNGWIEGVVPLVAGGVQVGVADAAVEDFDLDVTLAQRAALKAERSEGRRGIKGGIALGIYHVRVSVGEAVREKGCRIRQSSQRGNHMSEEPKSDWDPRSADALADQIAAYDALRARCPVAYSDYLQWSLLRHADVMQVLLDHETFSSAVSSYPSVPNGMDPPEHGLFRRLIEPYF